MKADIQERIEGLLAAEYGCGQAAPPTMILLAGWSLERYLARQYDRPRIAWPA